MKLTLFFIHLILTGFLFAACGKSITTPVIPGSDSSAGTKSPDDKKWIFENKPVWFDEFDNDGKPDTTKWGYDTGCSGWGNNELEYYTNGNNSAVKDGKLIITARKEDYEGMKYTSSRMDKKNKGDFLYGRFEVKAKIPAGRGTWPAIWMLPTDWEYGGWPKSGEIDIMEHVGYDLNNVHITVHTEAFNHSIKTQKGKSKIVGNATTEFHLYRVDWTPNSINGYINDDLVFTFVNNGQGYKSWPFDKRFHLLLNIAVGGNWGGAQGVNETIFPAAMEVDYVRVYKMIEK